MLQQTLHTTLLKNQLKLTAKNQKFHKNVVAQTTKADLFLEEYTTAENAEMFRIKYKYEKTKELPALYKIKERFGGGIYHVKAVNCFTWRLNKKEDMIRLLLAVNGWIFTDKRYQQLAGVCQRTGVVPRSHNFSVNNAWLLGFFDAEGGHFC